MAPAAVSVAAMGWSNTLTHSVGGALYHQSPAHFYHDHLPSSIDGYAFNCNGLVIGFYQNDLYCQGASGGETFDCGTFDYNGFLLTGTSTVFSPPDFSTLLWKQDGLLVSFSLPEMTCNVVSLDWHNYSLVDYVGLECPPQPIIPDISLQRSHFSFGVSGDVALRQMTEITTTSDSDHPQILRDSYGVYRWMDNNDISIYFGPQQGRQASVMRGTMSKATSELYLEGYDKPCVHDGTSTLATVETFPQQPRRGQYVSFRRALDRLKQLFDVKELWAHLKKSESWLLMVRMGGLPALGVAVSSFLTHVVFENKWPRIALHPSFVPLLLDHKNSTLFR